MPEIAHRVRVGKITVPHGLRGLVKIKPFTEAMGTIADFPQFQDEDGEEISLCIVAEQKSHLIAKIKGVSGRVQAEEWVGKSLYVMRSDLPSLGPDEYYCTDLIGLNVTTANGESVGTVQDVHDFGAGGILEIERDGGAELLLPFSAEIVAAIDMVACRVVISATAIQFHEGE
ncbi:MAG: ribosome maturation factor RimM [Pseudomonadota bacterium]|nr:ribosome maturation factor RimM [Pseudomonadota bacterium]